MRAYFPILKIIKINSIDLYVDIYVYQTVSYCFVVTVSYCFVVTFEIKKYEPSKFVLFLGGFGYFGGSDGNASSCNAGDPGSIPGLGRSPGEGKGYLLQYSGLEKIQIYMRIYRSLYSPWGLEESDMTERLHFHFQMPLKFCECYLALF